MTQLNFPAIAVSAVLSLLLGFLWFTVIFREPYLAGLERTTEQLNRGPSIFVASLFQLLGNVLLASVLAYLMKVTNNDSLFPALRLACIVWSGFVAAVIGPMYAYQAFSPVFFLITSGYPLTALLLSATIISLWP